MNPRLPLQPKSPRAIEPAHKRSTAISDGANQRNGGFLFVTFKGEETTMTEQVYFAISRDGRAWESLNDAKPVLVSDIGEKGVRDPFLIRSPVTGSFILIATDLSIHRTAHDWKRAVTQGSRSILVWESDDLVRWSAPRLAEVAPPDAGCAWAPEAVWNAESGDFLLFWASTTARDDFAKHRIWAAKTPDFHMLSEPFVYIEKPSHVIDTTIIRDNNGVYTRFSKDETTKAITMERSGRLSGTWKPVDAFTLAGHVGYEGPACFPLPPTPDAPSAWCLLLDHYTVGRGYQAFVAHDLVSGIFEPATDVQFPYRFRHGSVLPITSDEIDRLYTAWSTRTIP